MATSAPVIHPAVAEGFVSPGAWSLIESSFSPFAKETLTKVVHFVMNDCIPVTELYESQISTDPATRWKVVPPIIEELKKKAKAQGLWNLFLSKKHYPKFGVDLTNVEYAIMAEIMGRGHHFISEAMNCSAPDTGNMELLAKYGTEEQQNMWLKPLLNGEIRSSFAMTERFVASSDATNICTSIKQEGDEIVINGHKWWISGAGDPRCEVHLLMGKSHPENPNKHAQQSVVIIPSNTPGVNVIRPMQVFGYDDAPEGHCEIIYTNVRVPVKNLILGWNRGFEVIQGRLGGGRIHHVFRTLGAAETALEYMIRRATDKTKTPFGKMLGEHGTVIADLAQARIQIEQGRLLALSAARMIDIADAKAAQKQIAYAKVAVIDSTIHILDRAMQLHGGSGLSQEFPLASMYAASRSLAYADGPQEIHTQQMGKAELKRSAQLWERFQKTEAKANALLKAYGVKPRL